MLIEFHVKNFGPFRDHILFSMVASNYDKTTFENKNVVHVNKFDLRLLKSAAIYGSNASGKSQLFSALGFTVFFVNQGSIGKNILADLPRFRLDDVSEDLPIEIVIMFLENNKLFEYGFKLAKDKVQSEWLYFWKSNRRSVVFKRNVEGLHKPVSKYFKVGNTLDKAKLVKEWNLYLSKAFEFDQPGNELILDVKNWFQKVGTISGIDPSDYESFTHENLNDPKARDLLVNFIKNADFCLDDVVVQKSKVKRTISEPDSDDPQAIEFFRRMNSALELLPEKTVSDIKTKHKKFRSDGSFDFVEFSRFEESEGTLKFISISGPIIDTLTYGGVLIVDELDTKLHPTLADKIIELFNSNESNPNNAQLIFTSHNLSTMEQLRRDQIWFTKKDRFGVSSLDPLSNYKYGLRKEDKIATRYLDGRFGAIPFLGKFGFTPSKISSNQ